MSAKENTEKSNFKSYTYSSLEHLGACSKGAKKKSLGHTSSASIDASPENKKAGERR